MKRPKKYAIAGASLFSFGVIFGWMGFPAILKSQIKAQVALKPGSEMRDLWSKFPLPLDFKVYLFNVTNAEEVAQGMKPILKEVGPYFYDEYKEKVDLVDREEDDSVEYSQKATWFFNPSKSNGLTGEEDMVFPHVLILAIVMSAVKDKPAAVGVVGKAVDSIFKKPPSVFVKAKAKDIIFGGLPVDCTVKDFAGSAVCSILKENAGDLEEISEGSYMFSLFGHKNGTILKERIRVLRGIKNYKDLGRVIEYDGLPALTIWPEDHCNAFNGTDSTIFPPLMTEDDDIVSFAPELCRSLSARRVGPGKIKGVTTSYYTANLGDPSTNKEEKCFCTSEDVCLGKNLYDLSPCLGIPIIGSLPHFYLAEQKYLDGVDGLHPSHEEHEIEMDFEMMTATPLQARKRLQFNMFVFPVPKFKLMKTFADVLLPMFWVEEGILLDDEFVKQLKDVFKIISIVTYMKWLMIFAGMGLGGASAYMRYKAKSGEQKVEITKVSPQNGSRKESGTDKKWPQMNISTIQAASVPANIDRS